MQVRSLLCSSFLELFYLNFYPVVYLIVFLSSFSLNGNVAQSVERKSHNLKVVSSILTVPTFFTFFPCSFLSLPSYDSLVPLFLYIVWAYGAMETHQTSDLRIAGSTPAMLAFFPFCPLTPSPYSSLPLLFLVRERSSVGRA